MIAIVPRGGGLCAAGKSFEQFTQQKVENKMNQHNRAARLCRLFFSTLYISSFTFGGGFVIVTFQAKPEMLVFRPMAIRTAGSTADRQL
jgi:hypothetical protein